MASAEIPELRTRKPTGKPPWPMILIAGAEKSGKSYSAAAFSASDLIDRTFWVEIGEGAADQYGALPGARYEIVEHDGTYKGIARAFRAATLQPRGADGKPHAIVADSMTELWDLLSDEAQLAANRRKNKGSDDEAQITMDLWNVAKKRWRRVIDLLREYDGPVILTSRLEQVAVMDAAGKPTAGKTLKVRSEKNLPYEVDAIVQIPAPRQYQLTGVRSVHWTRPPGEAVECPEFTVDWLLRKLGLDAVGATSARSYTATKPEAALTPQDAAEAVVRKERADREQNPPATEAQRTKLILLMKDKLGITIRERRIRAMSTHLGREIATFKDIAAAEAHAAIDALSKLGDHIADAETVPDPEPQPEMPAAPAPLPDEPQDGQDFHLPASVGPEGICVDMESSIGACVDRAELEFVGQRITELADKHVLHEAHLKRLDAAWRKRNGELTAEQPPRNGWSHDRLVGAGLAVDA